MAYTPPTASDVKTRFPEFASVADATIESVLTEAAISVTERWIEAYRRPAVMYYTAHELRMAGLGSSAAAKISQIGDFSRIKSGDLEVSRGSQGAGGGNSGSSETYSQTQYGQKFLELRALCFPGILSF